MKAMMVSDIVEANGLTVKENNLAKTHDVPLGTLVEITYESEYDEPQEKMKGLRLFVVNHSRDCDGTPLYDLSFKRDAHIEYQKYEQELKTLTGQEWALTNLLKWQAQGHITRHWGRESIKVV